MDAKVFEAVWQQQAAFTFACHAEEAAEDTCPYAARFAAWAEALYQETVKQPTQAEIYQGICFTSMRYYQWLQVAPKKHRERVNARGHVCLFHIWERYMSRYLVLELSLSPPKLLPPPLPPEPAPTPPPAKPPIIQMAGITFGEIKGSEE